MYFHLISAAANCTVPFRQVVKRHMSINHYTKIWVATKRVLLKHFLRKKFFEVDFLKQFPKLYTIYVVCHAFHVGNFIYIFIGEYILLTIFLSTILINDIEFHNKCSLSIYQFISLWVLLLLYDFWHTLSVFPAVKLFLSSSSYNLQYHTICSIQSVTFCSTFCSNYF